MLAVIADCRFLRQLGCCEASQQPSVLQPTHTASDWCHVVPTVLSQQRHAALMNKKCRFHKQAASLWPVLVCHCLMSCVKHEVFTSYGMQLAICMPWPRMRSTHFQATTSIHEHPLHPLILQSASLISGIVRAICQPCLRQLGALLGHTDQRLKMYVFLIFVAIMTRVKCSTFRLPLHLLLYLPAPDSLTV